MIKIVIGGDLVPTQSDVDSFISGDISHIVDEEILSRLQNVDYRVFNLEVPLTDVISPIDKAGPNLKAPMDSINGIKALNPSVLGLANNHILDQGEIGLKNTIKTLNTNKIHYVGAGENLEQAKEPFIIEKGDKKIGIYACAENEFTIATERSSGANPFDPLESLDDISKLREQVDYVLVLYHGGKEHYRYPTPYLQKVCRKMIDKGADVVVCQHSHCIGAFEKYSDGTILYGQGNFIFDLVSNEYWDTSVLMEVTLDKRIEIEYIPIYKKNGKIILAKGKNREKILRELHDRSQEILEPRFIDNRYRQYCDIHGEEYLRIIGGYGRISRKLDRILKGIVIRFKYRNNKILVLRNFVECEAHRELLITYLDNKMRRR